MDSIDSAPKVATRNLISSQLPLGTRMRTPFSRIADRAADTYNRAL